MNDRSPSSNGALDNGLSRSLKKRHVMMISIGGIIGAGLFVGSSTSIVAAGPAAFISYAITGLIVFLEMRMLAEMVTALPHLPSFTEAIRLGLGDCAAFVSGWLYWLFWVLVVPVEAIAGANILQTWIPLSLLQLGFGLMVLMTGVNLLSALAYAELEFWFSSIKVAAIIVFIALAVSFTLGWFSPNAATLKNLFEYGGFAPHGWIAVLATVPTTFFAMVGAETVTIAAAESVEPEQAVAKISNAVILRIGFFYVVSIFLIVSVVPWTHVRSGESPFTLALDAMHMSGAGAIMSAIILTAVLSCLNSSFYLSSRVLFVLAAHGDAPPILVRLNARGVPIFSTLISSAAGFAGIVAATKAPQAVFDILVSSTGALVVFVYIAIALAHITLRLARERAGATRPRIQMWLFPYLSIAVIATMSTVLVAMAFAPALQQELEFSCLTLAITVLAYWVVRFTRVTAASRA